MTMKINPRSEDVFTINDADGFLTDVTISSPTPGCTDIGSWSIKTATGHLVISDTELDLDLLMT
jgi:hypothetical protein